MRLNCGGIFSFQFSLEVSRVPLKDSDNRDVTAAVSECSEPTVPHLQLWVSFSYFVLCRDPSIAADGKEKCSASLCSCFPLRQGKWSGLLTAWGPEVTSQIYIFFSSLPPTSTILGTSALLCEKSLNLFSLYLCTCSGKRRDVHHIGILYQHFLKNHWSSSIIFNEKKQQRNELWPDGGGTHL